MKRKLKITVVLVVAALLSGMVVYDGVRAAMFHITVESVSSNPVPADGKTPVDIVLKLTDRRGNPVEGHNLFALPKNGGALRANRVMTDGDGCAHFIYIPYKLTNLIKLEDVVVDVIDESNSVFVEINTRTSFEIQLTPPEEEGKADIDFDSIFGE